MNVVKITKTCIACPAQWEGETDDGRPVYVRYRGGYLSVSVGPVGDDIESAVMGESVFEKEYGGQLDGWLDYGELRELTSDQITWPDYEENG